MALLFLALKAGNVDSMFKSEGYQIYAEFDNIGGLKAKAPVKSAGASCSNEVVYDVGTLEPSNEGNKTELKDDLQFMSIA